MGYLGGIFQEILLQALIYWFLAAGLWLSFRVFRYPDLALEMYIVSGGMLGVTSIALGLPGLAAGLGWAALISLLLGVSACLLWKWGRMHAVIVSLILSYIIYSLLLYFYGPLVSGGSGIRLEKSWGMIALLATFIAVGTIGAQKLLNTRIGAECVAVASNPDMAYKLGLPVRLIQTLALSCAFFLGHVSGMLHGLHYGYTNISDGIGFLMVAIFCVFTSHALFQRIHPLLNALLLLLALFLFFGSISAAIEVGMDPSLTKAVIALMLVVMLILVRRFNKEGVLQVG